jgi:hypothetical protein
MKVKIETCEKKFYPKRSDLGNQIWSVQSKKIVLEIDPVEGEEPPVTKIPWGRGWFTSLELLKGLNLSVSLGDHLTLVITSFLGHVRKISPLGDSSGLKKIHFVQAD